MEIAICIVLYVIASYALCIYATWHDAKLNNKTFSEEMTPACILAPLFSPVVAVYMFCVICKGK